MLRPVTLRILRRSPPCANWRGARTIKTRRAQSAFSVGLRHIYQGEAATFAVVARVLERAYAEVEHTLANGVHADVSSDA
jgi:hypothetical protein